MDFSERLNLFIKSKKLRKNDLPERWGIGRSTLFAYLRGESSPTIQFMQTVKADFPELNIDWLVSGLGKMDVRLGRGGQIANGDGNVQIGGQIKVGENSRIGGVNAGRDILTVRESAAYKNGYMVALDDVIDLLGDYLAPKAIEEIKSKLSK